MLFFCLYCVVCLFWSILVVRIAYKRGKFTCAEWDPPALGAVITFVLHFAFCPLGMLTAIINDDIY